MANPAAQGGAVPLVDVQPPYTGQAGAVAVPARAMVEQAAA